METKPEQQNSSPTEMTKGFMNTWERKLMVTLGGTVVGTQLYNLGLRISEGEYKRAIISGVIAGLWGASTILNLQMLRKKSK